MLPLVHIAASALSVGVVSGAALDTVVRPSGDASDESVSLPEGVLHFPLYRDESTIERAVHALLRRDDTTDTELNNTLSLFSTELQVGSTKELVSVQVDTGSSDLWLMSSTNPYCGRSVRCQPSAMFDSSKSTTFHENDTHFHIRYGDSSFANGSYCSDDIEFGGQTIRGANFAIAEQANSTTAVWGIGLVGSEALVTTITPSGGFEPTYANIPLQMKQQGLIKANAYSLWLNDVEARHGSLLFGGVDHARYSGALQSVPLVSNYQNAQPNTLSIVLNGISVYDDSNRAQIVGCSLPALLDSGTTFMVLPGEFLNVIAESLNGQYTVQGQLVVECGLSGGLSFDFSGITIDVPFSQLAFQMGPRMCYLGVMQGDTIILGDTFLRSAYVVYDLDNYEIALAKPVYNASSSNVEAISSGIPSATQAPSYSSTSIGTGISTSAATFFAGSGGRGFGQSMTTQAIPTTESFTAPTSQSFRTSGGGGGGILGSLFGTRGSSSSTAAQDTSQSRPTSSGRKSRNAAAHVFGGNAFGVGTLSSVLYGILSLLLYV